jgi:multidrug efflux pump subunit AcrA (membrane-fusion protein)
MTFLRKKSVLGAGLAAGLVAAALGLGVLTGCGGGPLASSARASGPGEAGGAEAAGDAIPVKTIRAKHDPSFSISVEQPAYVVAYYQADLKARVAGAIKPGGILVNIGDRVEANDALVRIAVPDLEQDVKQREAVIAQRQSEMDLARANLKTAGAAEKAAAARVKVKQEEVGQAEASERFRQKELRRFTGLASGPYPAATADVIDEATERYEAAKAGSAAARAAVVDAQAELEKMKAKSEAALADVKVAESLVGVTRKDRDKAQALLDFATIRAPFDGVVTRRNVDPGTFVQNATTANTEPLLTVVRDDIVTIYMKVPDRFAPYVTHDTTAIIQMDTLPGLVIRGKVTRRAPSLDNPEHDRTMRVEVDLYNNSLADFEAFLAREKAEGNSDLKSKTLPVFPKVEGRDVADHPLRLMPGQYGKMRLVLNNFQKAFLLPHSAVVSQGGTSYVFVVKDGRALKMPVEVQADNGEVVKVALIEKVGGQPVTRDLTGDEEIVSSNQGELSNGQAVKMSHVDW